LLEGSKELASKVIQLMEDSRKQCARNTFWSMHTPQTKRPKRTQRTKRP